MSYERLRPRFQSITTPTTFADAETFLSVDNCRLAAAWAGKVCPPSRPPQSIQMIPERVSGRQEQVEDER
jgi:hypothetical protein